jgi:hypothetical protein
MARTLAEIWLATGGHGVYEHLGTAPRHRGRRIPEPRGIMAPRAEDLLCGCLAFYGSYARDGAARAGLTAGDFTTAKARAFWTGGNDATYRDYVMAEYDWAADEVLVAWCERKLAGAHDAALYDATATEIAEALAGHIVRLARTRALLLEAERVLQGTAPVARGRRTGVAV